MLKKGYLTITVAKICASAIVLFSLCALIYRFSPGFQARLSGVLNTLVGNNTTTAINLSSLVWLNGWSQATHHFVNSNGLGVGFNQMGCGKYEYSGIFTNIITKLTKGFTLNANDGSFLASKLISEMGALGIVMVLLFFTRSIRSILALKNFNHHGCNEYDIARAVGGATMISLLFIRSAGYFLLPVILSFSLLYSTPIENRYHAK